MSVQVKVACRGTDGDRHDQRMLKTRFRYVASSGATGWQVMHGSSYVSFGDVTGAMLWGEQTAADGRYDLVCLTCGNKLDRRGSNLVPTLELARQQGTKILFLDELQDRLHTSS